MCLVSCVVFCFDLSCCVVLGWVGLGCVVVIFSYRYLSFVVPCVVSSSLALFVWSCLVMSCLFLLFLVGFMFVLFLLLRCLVFCCLVLCCLTYFIVSLSLSLLLVLTIRKMKSLNCPEHDPNCGCHGPIMTKGLVFFQLVLSCLSSCLVLRLVFS